MEFVIKPEHDKGFLWYESDGIYVKGFLFNDQDHLLKEKTLISYFQGVVSPKDFKNRLYAANGQFAVIINKGDEVYFSVDRTRTFPLVYSLSEKKLIVSDSSLIASGGKPELYDNSIQEFLTTGYVLGKKSLIKNVSQLIGGEFVHYKNKITTDSFFDYKKTKQLSTAKPLLEKELKSVLDNLGNRLIKVLNGRTAVIPLSGGYDSRLIAALLTKNNYKNIICFTYGVPSSYEVKTSRKVAQQLKLPWHFVHYNKTLINGFIETEEFHEYYPYATNYVSSFFTQDYFAVRYLKQNNLIPKDSVFIPGHSGDLLAGGSIPKDLTEENLLSYILKRHFNLRKINTAQYTEKIKETFIGGRPFEEFDNWNFKERQGKFIINSNRVFEFFGHKHLIPLWDKELILFFQNLELSFKINQNLYNKVLFNSYFQPLKIDFKKPNYPYLIKKTIGLKNRLYRYVFCDPTNFKYIASQFIRDEELKVKWNSTTININTVQTTWYILKLKETISN